MVEKSIEAYIMAYQPKGTVFSPHGPRVKRAKTVVISRDEALKLARAPIQSNRYDSDHGIEIVHVGARPVAADNRRLEAKINSLLAKVERGISQESVAMNALLKRLANKET